MFSLLLRRRATAAHRTLLHRAYASSPTPPPTVAGLSPSDPRPQMIFMAGLPGSGKTTAIKKLYGLDNVELLDIDVEMIEHPAYDVDDRAAVYALPGAYEWADRKVGERLRRILGAVSPPPLVVLDGTGTKVARRVMRMNEARSAGFRTTLLYVKVGLATALQRNSGRKRVVPEDVMVGYLAKLEAAIAAERGHVDEVVVYDNESHDGLNGRSRWESAWEEYNIKYNAGHGTRRSDDDPSDFGHLHLPFLAINDDDDDDAY